MSRFKEEELIKALKETGATKVYPAMVPEIHKKLEDLEKLCAEDTKASIRVIDDRTVSRNLRQLLGGDDGIEKTRLDKDGCGLKELDGYCLGFKKKGTKITGYWYEKKVIEDVPGEFPRFLMDSVVYSKVLSPEFKPAYYDNLQDIFGKGQVKDKTEFVNKVIEYMPYSENDDGGINVMKNVLDIQSAIDRRKKIKFTLYAYRYEDREFHLRPTGNQDRCVSPVQIMMSNGRYYLMAKNRKIANLKGFLFYRIDLMDEIIILDNQKSDDIQGCEWRDPQKFLTANPYFYSGKEKEDIIIGFEENQITQVVDWFGAEENGLYEILDIYKIPQTIMRDGQSVTRIVKMVKLKFRQVNIQAFSFWLMQYIDCLELLEGEKMKKMLKERMQEALEKRIK